MDLRVVGVSVGLSSCSQRLGWDATFSSTSWESWRSDDYSGMRLAGTVFVRQWSWCLVSWRCSMPRVRDVVYGILVVVFALSLSLVSCYGVLLWSIFELVDVFLVGCSGLRYLILGIIKLIAFGSRKWRLGEVSGGFGWSAGLFIFGDSLRRNNISQYHGRQLVVHGNVVVNTFAGLEHSWIKLRRSTRARLCFSTLVLGVPKVSKSWVAGVVGDA